MSAELASRKSAVVLEADVIEEYSVSRAGRFSTTVLPPRGPRVRRGVLSTRAPHRPNPIALSALRLVRVEGCILHVHGIDLLDGTPILDVKPYVPYTDAYPDSAVGWLTGLIPDAPDRF